MLSSAKKRYLFSIYELGQSGNEVLSKDIASSLGVKRPSASKMLNTLADEGLIEKEYYGTVQFTQAGARLANKLYTNYLLLHAYFLDILGIPPADARKDSILCLCELSENGIERISSLILNC